MESNILFQGVSELFVVKDIIVELNENKEKRDNLELDERKLEKVVTLREKSISDEINGTTKKRKEEIESAYDVQADKIKAKIKKIRNKKEKSKSKKISERIELETEDLKAEYKEISLKVKDILREYNIPSFCNSNLFFSLYLPKGFGDFFRIFICLLIALFILPCGIYFYILPVEKIFYLVLVYVVIVVILLIIYMLIENYVKDKHIIGLKEIRVLRSELKKNKKKQNKVIKSIKKDKDESIYKLENFDQELQELDKELEVINEQKRESLVVFDNTTKYEISNEIKSRYVEELEAFKVDLDNVIKERKQLEERIKTTSLNVANTYEVYLGKEFMTVEKLETLATLMKDNELKTVSEAIALYKRDN
jgi:hypothetical protein